MLFCSLLCTLQSEKLQLLETYQGARLRLCTKNSVIEINLMSNHVPKSQESQATVGTVPHTDVHVWTGTPGNWKKKRKLE